ncbi:hypothetical protein QQ045_019692 [Rhodiola kirilowii]
MPSVRLGYKDNQAPSKDQKSVKFDLRDEDDEDDYNNEHDFNVEDYTDDEDYTDEDGEDEVGLKHPLSKMMPFVNGKGHRQGHGQGMIGMNMMMMMMMMMNDKMGGKGGGGNAADMKSKLRHTHLRGFEPYEG